MPHRTTNFSILVGAILVAFVCSILLVSSLLFSLGVSLSWFQVPLATAMAAGFGWWVANQYFPQERVCILMLAVGICVAAVVSFCWVSGRIYDVGWDGQWYHAEAILHLVNGWNPFWDALPVGATIPTQLSFYAKGPWITAAAMNKFVGNFEAGKALHLTLMLVSWLFSLAAVSTFAGLAWPYKVMVSLVLAISPVSICQMFTYYVDGQLSSLLISALSLLILLDRRPDRVVMVALMLVVVLTINVKLNGAVYIGIITIGYWLWYVLAKRQRWGELGIWLLAGGVVGGGLIGFNPYVNEFLSRLYTNGYRFLFTDWASFLQVTIHGDSPPNFARMGRFEQLLASLFSRSEVLFWSPTRSSRFKLPFTLSLDEIQVFWAPDVRTGGFGPLFSGALILSLTILVIIAWKFRDVFKDSVALLLLTALVILSGIPNSKMWWARFVPQFWAVPALVGLIGLRSCPPARLRWVALALFLTLGVNNLLVASTYLQATRRADQIVAGQLTQLKRSGEPILVRFNRFAATRYRFQQEGIQFVEVSALPCDENKRTKLAYSQAIICASN